VKYTTEEVIQKFKSVHGDTYDYSKVVYTGMLNKVTIVCKEHGDFQQVSSSHLTGRGCKKCSVIHTTRLSMLTEEEVVSRLKQIHSDKYDYSEFKYTISRDHSTVICKVHGSFSISVTSHLSGKGCKQCATDLKRDLYRSNTEDYIGKAHKIHGDKYDLSKVVYGNNNTDKVEIICKTHGSFFTRPSNFLQGKGCSSCTRSGFHAHKPAWMYLLKAENGIVKVGISNNPINRLKEINRVSKLNFKTVFKMYLENGQTAFDVEQQVLKQLRSKYKQVELDFSGSTECFYDVPEVVIESMIVSELLKTQDTKMSEN